MVNQNSFEQIEHAKHIYDILGIYSIKKSKVELNISKFAAATIFFLDDMLQDIKKENIPEIQIIFDEIPNQDSNGKFIVVENCFIICLSTKNIEKQFEGGFIQNTLLDSFFYVLLHEIAHLLQFLKLNNNNKKEVSLETLHEKDLEKRRKEIDQIQDRYKFDDYNLSTMNYKDEIEADRFAYKHLHYYKTLYNHNGYNYCSIYMCVKEEKDIG